MSPCETVHFPVKGVPSDGSPMRLEDYAVTTNGFIPNEQPLERLPNPYYAPWESLMDSLAEDIPAQTLRDKVNRLPVLSTDLLTTEPQWRRAFVVLGFLTHAYIWGGDTAAETLPPPITLPLLTVSAHLGMPPVATYACLNLWNFRTTTTSPFDPTNLDALTAQHTFTGTPDESWFYMVSVAMEAQGAHLVPHLLAALEALHAHSAQPPRDHNLSLATRSLHEMMRCIGSLAGLIDRMHERCDPQVFYHRIRPFLAGSKNMAAAGLPRGVFYDEGPVENEHLQEEDGGEKEGGGEERRRKGEWRQLRGGSNGQSSLIQFMDIALGVEHKHVGAAGQGGSQGRAGKDGEGMVTFHEEVRGYMPEPHRRFLEVVAERYPGGMRKAVEGVLAVGEEKDGRLSREQLELQEAFQTATRALAEFRNRHLQMVTRYIIIPSRQANGSRQVNLATASSRLESSGPAGGGELTGTGGTALLPFLKQSRDETLRAGQLHGRRWWGQKME